MMSQVWLVTEGKKKVTLHRIISLRLGPSMPIIVVISNGTPSSPPGPPFFQACNENRDEEDVTRCLV